MRAIGLVALCIAMMALLLTDADAKRRYRVRGARRWPPAEAGARPIPSAGSRTAATRASINATKRCWASAAFADPIRFRARRSAPATPGRQVRDAKAAVEILPNTGDV